MPSRKAGGAAKPPPKDDAEQSRRFEETARELDVDESGEAFRRAVGVVVPTQERLPTTARSSVKKSAVSKK